MRVVAPASAQLLEGLSVLLLDDRGYLDIFRITSSAFCDTRHRLGGASLDFGLRLRSARIAFIFASGYGENLDVGALGKSI